MKLKRNFQEPLWILINLIKIQNIEGFENALKSFTAKGNYDIYCTGSNADLLSGELATFLKGRYIEFNILPLSYNEFLERLILFLAKQTELIYNGEKYLKLAKNIISLI